MPLGRRAAHEHGVGLRERREVGRREVVRPRLEELQHLRAALDLRRRRGTGNTTETRGFWREKDLPERVLLTSQTPREFFLAPLVFRLLLRKRERERGRLRVAPKREKWRRARIERRGFPLLKNASPRELRILLPQDMKSVRNRARDSREWYTPHKTPACAWWQA